ncbi:Env9p [Sugiyamaella lignohabitans]|uniref:Env9p n=1 Tax=Sugiyamaella lignohabitans TaxID=796027 RepID=A0A167EM77_9ASCO|nr:Env9p [Sugiyamaella lignohabitans]ANB14243.1 Env9p [Sugiyamaella lignohabitans]
MKFSEFVQFLGHFRPSAPTFTEKDYPDQTGRVFIVTGGPTGIGYHVSRYLLQKNAKVWVVARSQTKVDAAITQFKKEMPNCNVDFFLVDFSDLATIKPGVQKFLDTESRLDGVFHNAGVMVPPNGSKTTQGYELQLGVNCVGPFLLQKYLDDIIIKTAKISPPNSTRIVWVSSSGHGFSPKAGIQWDNINFEKLNKPWKAYGQSKAINVYQGILWPKKHAGSGVVSLSAHPGNLKSELQRNTSAAMNILLYPANYGAYTELYGALHPSLTTKDNGSYLIPWGKKGVARSDIVEGANGKNGERLWNWLEEQVAPYYN